MAAAPALLAEAEALLPEVVALRRRLHADPELGLELPRTQAAVLEALEGLPLEIQEGHPTTSVVATLQGARPGPTILLRADMDALPLEEATGLEFASRTPGRMHACGHDAHTAMLAAAARLLAARRDELAGTVKLLFQPGEEGFGGMRVLIEQGLLETGPPIEGAFAIHVDPTLPAGTVATRPGPLLAATDVFSIELTGRGGHASMPHQTLDPIPVACEIATALQALVTRRIDAFDPVVLSVTRIEAGTTHNVIPERASLLGTIRAVSEGARRRVHRGIERVVRGICAAHEISGEVHLLPGYPVTVNDAGFVEFTRGVARALVGPDAVVDMRAPIMGAEDFSYLLEKVPGAMIFLGVRLGDGPAAPIHSNRMVLDEKALATGVAMHAAIALAHAGRAAGQSFDGA